MKSMPKPQPVAKKVLPWPAEVKSERLLLRPLTHEDAADVFAYASQPIVSKFLSWQPHGSIGDSHDFIAWARANYGRGIPAPWGIEHRRDQKIIGTISFLSYSPTHCLADIGYVLAPEYWGQGIAPEAVKAVLRHGFEVLGLNRVEAQCRLENVASARVLEKAGLCEEATLRQRFQIGDVFYDSRLFSALREEWNDPAAQSEADSYEQLLERAKRELPELRRRAQEGISGLCRIAGIPEPDYEKGKRRSGESLEEFRQRAKREIPELRRKAVEAIAELRRLAGKPPK